MEPWMTQINSSGSHRGDWVEQPTTPRPHYPQISPQAPLSPFLSSSKPRPFNITTPRPAFGRTRHMASTAAVAAAVATSPPRVITVAAVQFACTTDVEGNCRRAEGLIRDAARKGANIILLQELFASLYFPIDQMDCMRLAVSIDDDKSYILRFQSLARELNVVLPISFYERAK